MKKNAFWSTLAVIGLLSGSAAAQPIIGQTPDLEQPSIDPDWLFSFTHRFSLSGGKVENSPTFSLSKGMDEGFEASLRYATSSDIGGNFNEWEALVKRPLNSFLSGVGGYNTAAKSLDLVVIGSYRLGALTFLGNGKFFSSGFGLGGPTLALGTGIVWRLNRFLGVSADLDRVLLARNLGAIADQGNGLFPSWSLGTQFAIPYSPHALSLTLTNANTRTLQGTSRGGAGFRFGFEFSVPLGPLDRWKEIFNPPAE
ncbi:MAG TPA: hypothetical protein V6C82_01580 [Chroococcales cyanobacterium]